MTSKQKLLLVGIILLAIFFRFYQIGVMPGGLFPDEAANGLDINLMEQGHLQPFYERGNGREALFFYMEWASVLVFGRGPWQHHIVSAGIGVAAVLLTFFVTRKLFEDNKKAVSLALLATFFMASNTWHIVLSRTAFRANLIPLFTTLVVICLLKVLTAKNNNHRLIWSASLGASAALGFYTYIAYRIFLPILAVALIWPLFSQWQYVKKELRSIIAALAIFCIFFVIFIFPLAKYFYTHNGSFIGRSSEVSIFNPDINHGQLLPVFTTVTTESLLAFFTHGDLNWRHNISGYPFLSVLVSPFFAIGLIGSTLLAARYMFQPRKRSSDWKYFLLAGWFWGMLVPVVTTAEGIPHGLRSIGMIPPVFIMSAWGLTWVMNIVGKVVDHFWNKIPGWKQKILSVAFSAKTVAYVLAIILQAYFAYFVYAANSPENFYAFRSDLTVVSDYLKQHGSKTNTYLVLDKFSVQTTDYLTTVDGPHPENPMNQPYVQVDPEDSWKLPPLKIGDQVVFCQSSLFDIKKFKQYHPEAHLDSETRNQFQQTVMAVYKVY